MAPETANQKRKRGRPTNASRDDGDASGTQTQLTRQGQIATTSENPRESDVDDSSRPKKRGRRTNAETQSQAQPEPEPEEPRRPRRKRGPSPTMSANGDNDAANERPEDVPVERKRRGRPRLSGENGEANRVEEQSQSNAANENPPPKKRGRPAKGAESPKGNEGEADEADDENEGNSSLFRRSGRVRRSPNTSNKEAQEVVKPTDKQRPNKQKPKGQEKKGRSRVNEQGPEEADPETIPQPKKKRGRPSLTDQSIPEAEVVADPKPQKGSKKRGRLSSSGEKAALSRKQTANQSQDQPSQDLEERQEREQEQEKESSRRGRPRHSNKASTGQRQHRRSSDNQDRESSPDSGATPPPRYRHLATRTRRVPRNVIESKWTSLEAPAINSVSTLLQSASRPVLLRLNNPQKHAQAQAALTAVSNRLRSKISRGLPFPPATTSIRREDEFEYERTVSGIQALESQLDPLLHSVELLKREKDRAEKDLDNEYKALRRLGSNAHAEARERRERMRKMHVLVPDKPPGESVSTEEMVTAGEDSGKVFSDLKDDDDLLGLAGQIANHMESMRGNLQQIDGVVPAIARSKGLLRAALQSRLDEEVLENVILG
ncbi:hypothetical protein M426DRAFT_323831 [Hypoxylon sp. CI-4A]|nr:hypothetical protein M426DRAFT_323831 [Hypoxylon sp. CI-4A]